MRLVYLEFIDGVSWLRYALCVQIYVRWNLFKVFFSRNKRKWKCDSQNIFGKKRRMLEM